MICISVAPESHTLGKVDILNAAPQCDVVEVRLDRLHKTPNAKRLLEHRKIPVLISCRRREDGGEWGGSEQERLMVLRQAITAEPDFIELDIDIASKVPRFGPTKRVVSYTHVHGPLPNLEATYRRAADADADMIKFTAPTPTLESAWPLLQILNKKNRVPVIACGLGRPSLTLSLLSCKIGSPFIFAALEKGMEAHEGQATVAELEDVYRWRDITSKTSLIAVHGFGSVQARTIRALNAAFADGEVNARCLPVEFERLENMERLFDTLRIKAILPDPKIRGRIMSVAKEAEEAAQQAQQADLLLRQGDEWHAFNTIWRSAVRLLEQRLGSRSTEDRPLAKRSVLLVGASATSRAMAYGVQRREGLISMTATDDDRALLLAQMFDARFVPGAALYNTMCDIVVVTEDSTEARSNKFTPAYLRESMTVMDVSNLPNETDFTDEARARGCKVIDPLDVYTDQLAAQYKAIAGKNPNRDLIREELRAES